MMWRIFIAPSIMQRSCMYAEATIMRSIIGAALFAGIIHAASLHLLLQQQEKQRSCFLLLGKKNCRRQFSWPLSSMCCKHIACAACIMPAAYATFCGIMHVAALCSVMHHAWASCNVLIAQAHAMCPSNEHAHCPWALCSLRMAFMHDACMQ